MDDSAGAQFNLLAERCRSLCVATPGELAWEWDGFIGAALVAFDVGHADAMRTGFGAVFPSHFTAESVASAPEAVAGVARGHGGLRAGQELWAFHSGDHPLLYCAWWPWGGGARVSARVGIGTHDELGDGEAERALRSWFAIDSPS